MKEDGETAYYSVRAIAQGETTFFSLREGDQWERDEFWPVLIPMGTVDLFFLLFVAGSVIVGRNPKKFGKKTVRIFFREDYVIDERV